MCVSKLVFSESMKESVERIDTIGIRQHSISIPENGREISTTSARGLSRAGVRELARRKKCVVLRNARSPLLFVGTHSTLGPSM